MKKLLFILPLILVFSCTVQKRKYQNGYYVEWHNRQAKKETKLVVNKKTLKEEKAKSDKQIVEQVENTEAFASLENKLTASDFKKPIKLSFTAPEDSCDVLVFKDGAEIRGKIIEKNQNEIKYKRCDSPDGPTYISKKSELFMIKYSNGTREVMRVQEEPRIMRTSENPTPHKSTSSYRQMHPSSISALSLGIASIIALIYAALFATGIGLLVAAIIISVISAVAAVISGKTSLSKIKENPEVFKGKGMSVTGFIMGLVVLGIWAIILMLTLLVLSLI
ncbi:DUF4190 domain-containing protein [Aurantibacillus circumpalustris]|uniref:DUF4190 domain-containing protein n=1 Tax=Aurantibacillus circumpalustris TaxID=3036359 RepID=UPI00295A603A|nr:hypothetical protein [Aurantibacillus circumpalustris]